MNLIHETPVKTDTFVYIYVQPVFLTMYESVFAEDGVHCDGSNCNSL